MKILGIETSCDETAASVVEDGHRLLSNVVASSMDLHVKYGGVVPEIAARSHIESINQVLCQALKDAKTSWGQVDGIAVTYGAGLGGSLLIGVMAARTLAILHNKPLYACNHVEGHVYANFITEIGPNLKSQARISKQIQNTKSETPEPSTIYHLPSTKPQFPVLALIVSGGHTQLVLFKNHFDYKLLGRTGDDAIGEAFDKVAKILGLPYPGGPSISKAATRGDPNKYSLPKAKLVDKYAFSFSGIKTAVLRLVQKQCGVGHDFPSYKLAERLSEAVVADIAASFQQIAIETVVDKAILAYEQFKPRSVVIAGGVAANQELRCQLSKRLPVEIQYPDLKLCTDNGAMIATLGCYMAMLEQKPADPYALDIQPNLSM